MAKDDMKHMLECLTTSSLKVFAGNKGILVKSCKSKPDLVEVILPDAGKPPLDVTESYNSLDDRDKDFINYLLINKKRGNISDIFKVIYPDDWYSRINMRAVKSILLGLVPTGLVFFDPPSPHYSGSYKEDHYRFYIPEGVRDVLCINMINTFDGTPEPKSIKKHSTEDIVRMILLSRIDKESGKELPVSADKITSSMGDSIKVDDFGVYSIPRGRYMSDGVDLYKSMLAVAVAHLSDKERGMYLLLSSLPSDRWFDEQGVLDALNKYTGEGKCSSKTKIRLQALGLVETAEAGNQGLIKTADSALKESTGKSSIGFDDEPGRLYLRYGKLKNLCIGELFILFKYFDLKEDAKRGYTPTLSMSKIGHALENGEDPGSVTQAIEKYVDLPKQVKETLEEVDNRFGNLVLHKNLTIYEVNDPSIYYRMNKSYKNKTGVYFLNNRFLLIPKREQKEAEQFIRRSGFVIKEGG